MEQRGLAERVLAQEAQLRQEQAEQREQMGRQERVGRQVAQRVVELMELQGVWLRVERVGCQEHREAQVSQPQAEQMVAQQVVGQMEYLLQVERGVRMVAILWLGRQEVAERVGCRQLQVAQERVERVEAQLQQEVVGFQQQVEVRLLQE